MEASRFHHARPDMVVRDSSAVPTRVSAKVAEPLRMAGSTSLALVALGVALAAAALMGPLALGLIEWRVSANSLNQTYGADGAALALLAPASLAAALIAWRGRPVAAPLAFGVGLASLYYGVASVLGADYVQYQGNNERFFLLFLAIIVLSWTVAARGWSAMGASSRQPGRTLARATAVVFVAGGLAIASAWLVQLATIATNGELTAASDLQAYRESPSAFWLVRIVDLGFIVPLAVASGAGLWRGSPGAARAATGIAAFLTLQASAVLAMGVIMLLRSDPTATPGLVVVLAPITLALAFLTVRLLMTHERAALPDAPISAASRLAESGSHG
jgi:hypothetical protein